MCDSAQHKIQYDSIDIAKLLCSILVIGIHTQPFAWNLWLDRGFGLLCKIAVPFFFTASGFFLFSGNVDAAKVIKYVKRIFLLYAIWSLIYVCIDIAKGEFELIEFLINFFVFGYRHFWYLHASIFAVLMYWLIRCLNRNTYVCYGIAVLLMLINISLFTYAPLFHLSMTIPDRLTANNVMYAFPYFMLGHYLAKHKSLHSNYKAMLGIVVGFCFLAVEGYFGIVVLKTKTTIVWLSVILIIYCLFRFLICNPGNYQHRELLFYVRKCSTFIYCIHPLVIRCLYWVKNGIILFVIAFFMSLLLSIAMIRLSQWKPCKWIEYTM